MLGQASWQLPQLTFTILLKPETIYTVVQTVRMRAATAVSIGANCKPVSYFAGFFFKLNM